MKVGRAMITATCRRKFQASDVTRLVTLGELFKHRPSLAVILRFRLVCRMLTAVDQMLQAVLMAWFEKEQNKNLAR